MNDATTSETIKKGTILLKKHSKKQLYYVVERDPFHYAETDEYEYIHIMRLRRDGVGIGAGSATVRNRQTGKLVGFTIVDQGQVPAALQAWTR
jgi:hypothetical protein